MQRGNRIAQRHEVILRKQRVRQGFSDLPFRCGKRRRHGIPQNLLRKPLHKRVERHNARELCMQRWIHEPYAAAAVHAAAGIPYLPGCKAACAVRLVVPGKEHLRSLVLRIRTIRARAHCGNLHPAADARMFGRRKQDDMQGNQRAMLR